MSEQDREYQNEHAEFIDWISRRFESVAYDLQRGEVESAGYELWRVSVAMRDRVEEMEDTDQ